jgi:DNA polymerase III delta prime subunit
MDAIIGLSGGDMRKAVTTLQSAHQLYGGAAEISADVLTEVSGKVPTPVSVLAYTLMPCMSANQVVL